MFKSSQELKQFLPANAEFEWEQIKPFIERQGMNVFIPKYTGADLLALAKQNYEGNDTNNSYKKLIEHIQMPLAFYAMLKYVAWGQLNLSKGGILQAGDDKRKTPWPWQIKGLKDELIENAFIGVEQLLMFLEKNRDQTEFSTWTGSSGDTFFSEFLITNADEFDKIYSINSSRRTFHALRPAFREVERRILWPQLSREYITELKAQKKDGIINTANAKVIELITDAFAHYALQKACSTLPVRFTGEGLQIISSSENDVMETAKPADEKNKAAILKECEEVANDYMAQAIKIMRTTPDDFPTWKSSDAYQDPATIESFDQSNNGVVGF